LRSNRVELAVLDIMMPGRSGVELLPEIRKEHPDTAVIMATAVADPNIIVRCMREGAQDYILKPFDLDDVARTIQRVLHKRQLELLVKDYQFKLQGKVEEQSKQIRQLFLGAIESLVRALEAKDPYTAGHSRRVKELASAISLRMGMTDEDFDDLCWGALLHDVGKIAVDPAIQNKPGKLTPEEYEHVMSHAQVGPRIVKAVADENMLNIIRYHHSRYDSPGQVEAGTNVPIGARVVTVADAFDAMTSDRPYRKGLTLEEALFETRRCAGTQFDPSVVDAFLSIPVPEIRAIVGNAATRDGAGVGKS
jgi:putative two-component system response regulator